MSYCENEQPCTTTNHDGASSNASFNFGTGSKKIVKTKSAGGNVCD